MTSQKDAPSNKIRFKFYKKDEYKYLSHLDITRMIVRALKRAGLEVKYSLGYNPKPKINFSPPTPLGVESLAEYSDVLLDEVIDSGRFKKRINLELKPQMQVTKAKKAAIETANLMNDIAISLYSFELKSYSSNKRLVERSCREVKENLKAASDFSSSIFDLKIIRDEEIAHIFFLKLFGYAKIFKQGSNEFFKLNDFNRFFKSWLKDYNIGIGNVKKEELFVIRENMLKTPMEVI